MFMLTERERERGKLDTVTEVKKTSKRMNEKHLLFDIYLFIVYKVF